MNKIDSMRASIDAIILRCTAYFGWAISKAILRYRLDKISDLHHSVFIFRWKTIYIPSAEDTRKSSTCSV